MKYLVQNKDALIRTVVALIVAIIQLLKIFGLEIGVTEDAILSGVTIIVGAICWFYNTPTSAEGLATTKLLKEMKSTRGLTTPDVEEPQDSEVE